MTKLCRFQKGSGETACGIYSEEGIRELSGATITELLERSDPDRLRKARPELISPTSVRFLPPVDRQEIWAAGVTYLRSKKARMEESDFSATAYDKVYEAPRPELFFKSLPEKVSASGGPVGIRRDAKWNVPEPELALVINSRKELAGFTIGNDMSSRDIEGENLLYLPQAKIYTHSCAMGPCIVLGASESEAREWNISVRIDREETTVFSGQTQVSQIKRSFGELIDYLFRSQSFPHGVILLTGTGVVPGDEFTLQEGDLVSINISGIGTLQNRVTVV